LVVEVDGSQHLEELHLRADRRRDAYLAHLGLQVLRVDNHQVLQDTKTVVELIFRTLSGQVASRKSPLTPLC
jgi:very-short-patch-repair endonuclease